LDDEFDSLFGQPSKGPSQPVEDDSPIVELAAVKRKAWIDVSENSKDGNAKKATSSDSTHIGLDLNDEATNSEDVKVQEVRPIGRYKAKKKGSSISSHLSSSVAAHRGLVDALLEDVKVQEVRPIGRYKAKKKGSSFASHLSSSVAAHRGLVDALLGNFTKVARHYFRQRRNPR
nr:hypothetical protein [Tanacetum cinerariifolium]